MFAYISVLCYNYIIIIYNLLTNVGDIVDILTAISSYNSYYGKYIDEEIPKNDIQIILNSGLCAATLYEQHNVYLLAVDDKNVLFKLQEELSHVMCETAPVVILVLLKREMMIGNRAFSYQNAATASENILVSATSLGYSCRWVKGELYDLDNLGKVICATLDIPKQFTLESIIPIGRPAGPVEEKIFSHQDKKIFYNKFEQ